MQSLTLPIIHARGSMVCIYLEGRNTKTLDFPAVTLVLKDATVEMFYQDLSCNTAGHLHHERFFAATFGAYMKPLSNSRRRPRFLNMVPGLARVFGRLCMQVIRNIPGSYHLKHSRRSWIRGYNMDDFMRCKL
jgi:hypothetical protein